MWSDRLEYRRACTAIATALGCPAAGPGELADLVREVIAINNRQVDEKWGIVVELEKERDELISIVAKCRDMIHYNCEEAEAAVGGPEYVPEYIRVAFEAVKKERDELRAKCECTQIARNNLTEHRDELLSQFEEIASAIGVSDLEPFELVRVVKEVAAENEKFERDMLELRRKINEL